MNDNTYDFSLIESIIPAEFHSEIKQLIEDYSTLSDEDMYNKYKLEDLWLDFEEYEDEKQEVDLIGSLIVFYLVNSDYILQLDYKENPKKRLDEICSFWDCEEKIVRFDLDDDQIYLAKIPQNAECEDIFGVEIVEEAELTEKYLSQKNKNDTNSTTVTAPSASKKKYTIWQWKRDAKVKYPKETIAAFVFLCLVFASSSVFSFLLMFYFDPRSAVSIISYIFCVLSLILLAITLGCFKKHNTWNCVFIRDENGDVYYVDYTDHNLANALHFYELIPSTYKHGPKVMHSNISQAAGLIYYLFVFPKECKNCANAIRDHKVDQRVAEVCQKYGHKVISVPEIKKKSYYTFIRLNILKDGKEVEAQNLFDNCYDGYEEMVEYLDNHFEHDDPFKREKNSDKIRRLIFIGISCILFSILLFVINVLLGVPIINLIAAFGILVGIGFIAAYFSEKSQR